MSRLAKLEVLIPAPVQKTIDELLLFDARCLPPEVSRELVRLLPTFALVRRAWRNLYRRYGCNGCPKPDPTITICARLRRQGLPWSRVYRAVGADCEYSTLADRKHFKALVRRRMAELDNPRPLPKEQVHGYRSKHYHAAGGLCDKCRNRNQRRILRELAKLRSSPAAKEKAIVGLSRRYDAAQWLLNGEEKKP